MADRTYCYPGTTVLINKKGITDAQKLLEAEVQYTSYRLLELQLAPVKGKFDFRHLKDIHEYVFQDLYEWAGKIRTVDIGKGNLFCRVQFIDDYAQSIFETYYSKCWENRKDRAGFVDVLVKHYADLNALHPFREGNGRSQREFARELCLHCGYIFDLSATTHEQMLNASIHSFNTGDNTELLQIFKKAVIPIEEYKPSNVNLKILTSDDLDIQDVIDTYDYYE